jgi:hypothetical protein
MGKRYAARLLAGACGRAYPEEGAHSEGRAGVSVTVCLPLFGNAGQELEEGALLTGRQLRDLAAALQERLGHAADTLDRLAAGGWSCRVAMYDVLLSCPGVETRAQAEQSLRERGADPGQFLIVEDVEEDEVEGGPP